MRINDILIRPVLTEKATNLAKTKVYMFEVALNADKHQIRYALETLYKVKAGMIRIMVRKGKSKRVGKKMNPKKQPSKKFALVSVKEGKIDLFPQT